MSDASAFVKKYTQDHGPDWRPTFSIQVPQWDYIDFAGLY